MSIRITGTAGGGCGRPAIVPLKLRLSAMTASVTASAALSVASVAPFAPLCVSIWTHNINRQSKRGDLT